MNAQANTYNPASTGAFAAPIFGADARGCLITVKTPGEALPPAFKLKVAEAKTQVIIPGYSRNVYDHA
ncbi:MAG TPA: hypothetical protein PKA48_15515, partial [Candidatus Obscuribacter sp.]|nr:hypothetical protein [Candidatus Obscuribacter sp.]